MRIQAIPISNDMHSRQYKSKEEIISLGFDTIDEDFESDEADGIRLELLRQMRHLRPALFNRGEGADLQKLEDALTDDGYNLAKTLGQNAGVDFASYLCERVDSVKMIAARELALKTLRRINTDPSGAVTSIVSCLESLSKAVLERLNVPLPSEQTLPKLLVEIRRHTNIASLFLGDRGCKVLSSFSTLAENLYLLAHQVGDRHGPGEGGKFASSSIASLMVCCCASLAVLMIDALSEGELKRL